MNEKFENIFQPCIYASSLTSNHGGGKKTCHIISNSCKGCFVRFFKFSNLNHHHCDDVTRFLSTDFIVDHQGSAFGKCHIPARQGRYVFQKCTIRTLQNTVFTLQGCEIFHKHSPWQSTLEIVISCVTTTVKVFKYMYDNLKFLEFGRLCQHKFNLHEIKKSIKKIPGSFYDDTRPKLMASFSDTETMLRWLWTAKENAFLSKLRSGTSWQST